MSDHIETKQNIRLARRLWPGEVGLEQRRSLDALSPFGFSVAGGDLLLLNKRWYITHTGLLRLARRSRCAGIHVQPAPELCDPATSRWVFKATVFKSPKCKGFVGYGDADPSNVSPLVRGAEMRVAETRAVNRALRKAYGIGICSVEELGSFFGPLPSAAQLKKPATGTATSNGNGHPLRDRLCLLIRQHHLDPSLVKLYAADFCGTQELRQASRELVEDFIQHLAHYAAHDRDGLLGLLNSFAPRPVTPAGTNSSGDGPKAVGGAA